MTLTEDMVLEALQERLDPESVEHSRSVAGMAELLAGLYGVDAEKARVAALLHDWDRDISADELLEAAARQGIEVGEAERRIPYLLHARTGARDIAEQFPGIDSEIVDAVERHTTGAETMSDLDKVLYIADTIEPLRSYDGVDTLREAVGNVSLHDLFALCYAESVRHLVESRRPIHPDTVRVWNAQIARAQR